MRMLRLVDLLTAVFTLFVMSGCSGDSVAPRQSRATDPNTPDLGASSRRADRDIVASTAPAVAIVVAGFLRGEQAGASLLPMLARDAAAAAAASCGVQSANIAFGFAPQRSESDDDESESEDPGPITDSAFVALTGEFFSTHGCENAFVADSSDSIVFTASASEIFRNRKFIVMMHETGQFSVFGDTTLLSAKAHVWNGTASGADTSTHQRKKNRTLTGAVNDTATAVTFPNPIGGATVPTSGTFTRAFSGSVNVNTNGTSKSQSVNRRVVVTFDGTEHVPLQVFDPATGKVVLTCVLHLGPDRFGEAVCDEEDD